MLVTKCDNCRKEIKGKGVFASVGSSFLSNQSFCLKCGKPVVDFLNKLLKRKIKITNKKELVAWKEPTNRSNIKVNFE